MLETQSWITQSDYDFLATETFQLLIHYKSQITPFQNEKSGNMQHRGFKFCNRIKGRFHDFIDWLGSI